MSKKSARGKTEPKPAQTTAPIAAAGDVKVEKQRAVPAFTDSGVRSLMAELAAARFARVIRERVLSGKCDGEKLAVLLPDADEFDRLKQFAAQVASMERGACLDLAEGVIGKEQREPLASAFAERGPFGFTMSVQWTPETKIWMAK